VLRITPAPCSSTQIVPPAECGDDNGAPGDGCFSTCHLEDELVLKGTAQGGSVTVSLFGIPVSAATSSGQAAEQVLDALVAAIAGDTDLQTLGVSAVRTDGRLVTNGSILGVDVVDAGLEQCGVAVPGPGGGWLVVLASALAIVAALTLGAHRRRGLAGVVLLAGLGLLVTPSVLSASAPCAVHPPVSPVRADPAGLDFDGSGLVSFALVQLPVELLRPFVADDFAVDIEITSLNGAFHHHGSQVDPLSQTLVLSSDPPTAEIAVTWTADTAPITVGDIYTVCATLVLSGPVGPETCEDFSTN